MPRTLKSVGAEIVAKRKTYGPTVSAMPRAEGAITVGYWHVPPEVYDAGESAYIKSGVCGGTVNVGGVNYEWDVRPCRV